MGGIFTREERAVVLFLVASIVVGSLVLSVGRVDPSSSEVLSAGAQEATGSEAGRPLRVNINTGNASELERLPGVGPARAREIVRLRNERGAFGTVDELLDVRGIGPVTLERLRPFAAVDDTVIGPVGSAPEEE
jgi:competence protein ComEA